MKSYQSFLWITLLSLLCYTSVSAQNLRYAQLEANLDSIKSYPLADSLAITDFGGDTISVVVVSSPLNNLSFEGNVFKDVKKKRLRGIGNIPTYEYHINITEGSRRLIASHDSYMRTSIVFPSPVAHKQLISGIVITGNDYSESMVTVSDIDYKHSVNILVDDFSQLYIDQEPYYGNTAVLEEGVHYFTTKFNGEEYNKKVNIKEDGQEVDVLMSGIVKFTGARTVEITTQSGSPKPTLIDNKKKNTYVFGHILGDYTYNAEVKSVIKKKIELKKLHVDVRSYNAYHLDEMVGYNFSMYHGSQVQPIGINGGYCKIFGWFASFTFDLKNSIDTPYGEIEFTDKNSEGESSSSLRMTSMTIHTGPMFRVYRKLYLQVGGGLGRYLKTSQEKMLTADYEYKNTFSAGASLLLRIKRVAVGLGYTHQFDTKGAYDPDVANQFSFSFGTAW